MVSTLLRATAATATVATWLGGALLVLVCLMVGGDVLARRLLGVTLGGADELSGYAFAISTTWALSYTLLHRGHIRIDVIYARLSQMTRAVLDLVSLLSLGALGLVIAYYGYSVLERSLVLGSKSNTPLATPLWIPQLLWWAGLLVFLWTLALLIVATLAALASRDYRAVEHLAGIPRQDDGPAATEEGRI